MVVYNAATRELTAKIVYYGPGLCGKTTNLQVLHDRLEPATVGKLLNLSTHTDRTIYFDLLPVELGDIKGYKIRFQLATVPGQTAFNETRRVVLKGADGIVFVADSQWTMLPKNLECWQNLKDNLKANSVSFEGMPVVVQYNKRDLTDILSVDAMQEALGLSPYPFVEAVASAGRGVTETFKLISKLTFVDLLRRLQGRRPEEASLPPPSRDEKPEQAPTWKESLFQRVPEAGPTRPRPLAAVPSPSEEPPFSEEPGPPPLAEPLEGPFGGAPNDAPPAFPASAKAPAVENPQTLKTNERTGEPAPQPPGPAAPLEAHRASAAPARPGEKTEAAGALRDVEERLAADAERLARSAGEIARIDAACGALASRLEALERRSGESARAAGESEERSQGRLAALEERVERSTSEVAARAEALAARVEAAEQRLASSGPRLDGIEGALGAGSERLGAAEQRVAASLDRVEAQEKRVRALEDDAGMALSTLTERVENLQNQVNALQGQLAQLAGEAETARGSLDLKFSQASREAEDIRSQLSPLLDAHGRRHETDERLHAEIDRLREGLADSLADLSERLRQAVRGLGS